MSAAELRTLLIAENEAWHRMMEGSEADACTIKGCEGRNYVAWEKAAEAVRLCRIRMREEEGK